MNNRFYSQEKGCDYEAMKNAVIEYQQEQPQLELDFSSRDSRSEISRVQALSSKWIDAFVLIQSALLDEISRLSALGRFDENRLLLISISSLLEVVNNIRIHLEVVNRMLSLM